MKCPVCSLPEEWHDDGDCPTYNKAAAILFGVDNEPHDLRELVTNREYHFDIKPVGPYRWGIIKSYVNDYGRRVNELLDVRKTREELVALMERYRGVGKIIPG